MKERLTKWEDNKTASVIGAGSPIDKIMSNAINHLAEYEDLEEHGLLVRLPCKVGDKVYLALVGCKIPAIITVHLIEINRNGILIDGMLFGKTVFLTRAEAEKKLEELNK